VRAGRLLVIEDDVAVANLLRRGLELGGNEVTIAEDGSAGREAWESGGFDLILLDVMLPEVDGTTLCTEMRAANDRTPVILLTARDEDEARQRAMAAGATDYLNKPFDIDELLSRVRSNLRS
jgi:DNA-binding response OmpR family regulator